MIYRHQHHGGIWLDLEQPTDSEIHEVAREFGISNRIEAELLAPSPLPLVATDQETLLLIMHFPTHGQGDGNLKDQEVDFVVGKHFVITVRYEVIASLDHLRKLLETEELMAHSSKLGADTLLEILFAHLFASIRDHTNHLAANLTRVEHQMFTGKERETIRAISNLSREFLHLESALASQEEPLMRFLKILSERGFFGASFAERAARVLAERGQVARMLAKHRAFAIELRETNTALINTAQNEIMKTLTIMAFVTFPLTLISSLFGMNTKELPIVGLPGDFWLIIGMMVTLTAGFFIFFRIKHWL